MFKIIFTICLTHCVLNNLFVKCDESRNYVYNAFESAGGFNAFEDINKFRENYKNSIFKSLDELPDQLKEYFIAKADKSNKEPWISKLASQYLEFVTTGNRVHFETTDTNRRVHLVNLVIGELLTRNGTYMKNIGDGLWLIMEESSWETPGHMSIQKAGPGLPDPDQNIIDLRVGEMAATVSIIKLLLRDELDKVNKMFVKRINYELTRRVVLPYLNYDDYFWLGFNGKRVNNHNSWDNSNILRTALLGVEDETSLHEVVNRSIKSIDIFINQYPTDGGCDEGPTYWGWAGGRLIDYLELMTTVSAGRINWSANELLDKIGTFIYKVHISEDRYVNFADAQAKLAVEASAVYKFGHTFNDTTLKHFSSYVGQRYNYESIKTAADFLGSLSVFVSTLLTYSQIKDIEPKAPLPQNFYFKDLQVFTARTEAGSTKGLFIAGKAGTNHESHNHNDVGNYIIYANGKPFIIDVGVGVYNNETFSKDRYKIWSMQSQWHNCPTINGIQQNHGNKYEASGVSYSSTEDTIKFSADIAGAYPKEADVKSYVRNIEFNHKLNTITVTDDYELKKWLSPLKVHFISHLKTQMSSSGVQFVDKDNSLSMKYDSNLFDVVFDKTDIDREDTILRDVWGDSVNRVTLVHKLNDTLKATFVTTFSIAL